MVGGYQRSETRDQRSEAQSDLQRPISNLRDPATLSPVTDAIELEVRGVVVGLFQENCWIIGSRRRGEACVIDPGDEPDQILALARDLGVSITRIVASHAHLDHIMAVAPGRRHDRRPLPAPRGRPRHRPRYAGQRPPVAGPRRAATTDAGRLSR